MMTSRERLLAVLAGRLPDCVPAAPDFSNMIPAKMTGKPFWDIYLYNDPPLWQAYITAAKYFDIDSLMDGFPLRLPGDGVAEHEWETFIIERTAERIVTRRSYREGGRRVWHPRVAVYPVAEPAKHGLPASALGLPEVPERYEPLEGVKPADNGPEGFARAKEMMGDQGLIGVFITNSSAIHDEEGIFRYYDEPEKHERWAEERVAACERRFERLMQSGVRPDFICVGGSGTLVFQTVEMFRTIALPAVKRGIELATAAGLPTHIHSCGPEKQLVRIMAEETGLTVIDPLERPPMGDCDLAELKRLYGDRIVLKGNLHTTDVMLRGTVEDVVRESKAAIDAAAEGGRFILSTGDQCGRDTPDENLRAMVRTAREYGRY